MVDSPIEAGTAKPIIIQLNNYKTGSTFNMSARFKGYSAKCNSSSTHEIKILYNNLNGTKLDILVIGLEILLRLSLRMIRL